jgi:hypothetical protein
VRALTGKEARHRLADSGGGAGDQCDPILQHGHIITRGAPVEKSYAPATQVRTG